MQFAAAIAIVFGFMVVARVATEWRRSQRRAQASKIPDHLVVKMVRGVSARVFVDREIIDGPKPGVINNTPADLVLCADRLIVATRHGRVLEVTPGKGSVRCTGPRRLVIEGSRLRKDGMMNVRVEALVEGAEEWAELAAARLAPPAA